MNGLLIKKMRVLWILVSFLLLVFTLNGFCDSSSEIDFYKGKTIILSTPHGAGGGFDTYCRLIAPILEKYLPGSSVVVENVSGGGGIIGRNKLYVAEPDGLTIGLESVTGMMFTEIADMEGVRYKTNDFVYLGRVAAEPHIIAISAKSPYKKFEDMVGKTIKFAFSGVGSDDYYGAIIIGEALGIDIKVIAGYTGNTEATLAVAKGESEAVATSFGSLLPLIKSNDMVPILQISENRHELLPEVPTVFEVIKEADTRKFVTTLVNLFELDRVLLAPPGLSESKTIILREAIAKVFKNEEFIANAEKSNRAIVYLDGLSVNNKVNEAWANALEVERIIKKVK